MHVCDQWKVDYNHASAMMFLVLCLIIAFLTSEVYSREKKSRHQLRIEQIYRTIAPCLRLTGTLNGQYPLRYDPDLESHYLEMLQITAQYRGLPPHSGSGSYKGPWIENLFIQHFINKPFSTFNGIVPIFVQWSDYHLNYRGNFTSKTIRMKTEEELYLPISRKFRKHVLYLVISQANYGIDFLRLNHPNVMIFSAGGEGDVPIPLIKGEIPFTEIDRSVFPKYDVSFYGSIDHGHRKKVLDNFVKLLQKTDYEYSMGPSKIWVEEMSNSLFNLAPIGMGRASFRLGEIIQLGRIPVYLYEDFPWSPYEGSGYGPADIGYVIRSNNMQEVINVMQQSTNATLESKLNKIKDARILYTYEGILDQIERFFFDPFGNHGGYLRCKNDDRKNIMAAGVSLHR